MISKKTAYVILAAFLGFLAGKLFCVMAELYFLEHLAGGEEFAEGHYLQRFFSPMSSEFILACEVLGAAAGYRLGKVWWRIIYMEDGRGRSYKLDW